MTKFRQYNNGEIWKDRNSKRKVFSAKKPIQIWDVNVDNILISKLLKTNTNSKYLIEYSDKDIRSLVLIMPKISRQVKIFKVQDKNTKLISFRIDHEKLLEEYKAIWIKIVDLKNINLNALTVYDNNKVYEIWQ